MVKIIKLNKNIAKKYENSILKLHNQIPLLHWESNDLYKDRDLKRIYFLKWQISTIALFNNRPIGICIAFYNKTNNSNYFLYIHRLSVDVKYQQKGIGKNLILNTCINFRKFISTNECNILYVQTTKEEYVGKNNTATGFYEKLGFKKIGEKKYRNKIDNIYSMNIDSFISQNK